MVEELPPSLSQSETFRSNRGTAVQHCCTSMIARAPSLRQYFRSISAKKRYSTDCTSTMSQQGCRCLSYDWRTVYIIYPLADFPCLISPQQSEWCRCQTSRRELFEHVSFGIGTLLVIEQSSMEIINTSYLGRIVYLSLAWKTAPGGCGTPLYTVKLVPPHARPTRR